MRPLLHRLSFTLACVFAVSFGIHYLRGPQGIPHLLEKRRELRTLEEKNASLSQDIERKKEYISRLRNSQAEQERLIREHLKMLRPGERVFVVPDKK